MAPLKKCTTVANVQAVLESQMNQTEVQRQVLSRAKEWYILSKPSSKKDCVPGPRYQFHPEILSPLKPLVPFFH